MTGTLDSMHVEFPTWYKAVGVGDHGDRVVSRWAGVVNVLTEVDRKVVEALVRLAFHTRPAPQADVLQNIRDAFKKADPTFEMTGNDKELQILAAACLVALIERQGDCGSEAAISVTTASFGGARMPTLPMNLASFGEAALRGRGSGVRSIVRKANLSLQVPKIDFEKAVAKVTEQQDWNGVAQAFKLAAENAQSAFQNLARQHNNALSNAHDMIRVQDEELSMLWWLTGQHSEDLECGFEEVVSEAQPLVFAKELAEMTEFLPGPTSIKSILSRAGLKERKKLRVNAAVNALPAEWLAKLVTEDVSPITTPLHFAIQRQLETGPGDAWIAGWAAVTGVNGAYALPALTLSELFYRERLLLMFG